ncbi:bifunctional DNA-formamidopyrimidine glycosylase/DNA-(apurinic or apyrimidinic site) lyase [Aliihoeflea sp. PC F10.4]
MPELPEVETVRRGLAPVMEGARIVCVEQRRPDLRFPFPAHFTERLTGRRIVSVGRRAKFLVIHLDADPVLIAHLGMSGSFRVYDDDGATTPGAFHHERSKLAAHDHVVFHLDNAERKYRVVYNDPRRFGFMAFAEEAALDEHPFLAGLGIEPTGNALDGTVLSALLAGRRAPLKAALLDQRLIAGLGNIYVCEALWRAGLSPRRMAGTITGKRAARLADAVRAVIADAIAAGGSTLRDHQLTDGSLGYFQHSFNVYDREGEPCRRAGCMGTIKRVVQSGRSTFYCSACQR